MESWAAPLEKVSAAPFLGGIDIGTAFFMRFYSDAPFFIAASIRAAPPGLVVVPYRLSRV